MDGGETRHAAAFAALKRNYDGLDHQQLSAVGRDPLLKEFPSRFEIADIARELAADEDIQVATPGRLRAIRVCLEAWWEWTRNDKAKARPEGLDQVIKFAALAIAPIYRLDEPARNEDVPSDDSGDDEETDEKKARSRLAKRCLSMAEDGLWILGNGSFGFETQLSSQAWCTLLAYATFDARWSTPATRDLARKIVGEQIPRRDLKDVLVRDLLKGYVIPLFSKARPATITASGRKAAFPDEQDAHRGLELETREGKPWKLVDLRAVPVFSWVLRRSEDDLVGEHWPLFTPVILTLLDDMDTEFRFRGLSCAQDFFSKVEPDLLRATGLGEVFQDAIMPTLHFLPSLTPVADSVRLLGVAYRALAELANTQPPGEAKEKLMDKILRQGVFAGYAHAREYHRVVGVLAREAGRFAQDLGIATVKHLKDLMPMFSAILTDPFAMSHPETLTAAIVGLQDVILVCWPRLSGPPWDDELLKMIVVCWLNVLEHGGGRDGVYEPDGVPRHKSQAKTEGPARHDDDRDSSETESLGSDRDDPKSQLVICANQLRAVWEAAEVDVAAKIGPLTAKDGRLRGLFAEAKPLKKGA